MGGTFLKGNCVVVDSRRLAVPPRVQPLVDLKPLPARVEPSQVGAVSSMLQGHSPVSQALLGTFFTWGMTAAGAALVFVFSSGQRRILDGSLGFAAGGAAEDPQMALALNHDPALMKKSDAEGPRPFFPESELSIRIDKSENGEAYQRKKAVTADLPEGPAAPVPSQGSPVPPGGSSWRRIVLLILAITIHNIPGREEDGEETGGFMDENLSHMESLSTEGLAVGVGFGAVEKTASATFESARNLAIGIGIQNFPEGLAVSLPLRGAGFSTWRAFWYGQLSGMVEPLAGVFGAFAVVLAEPILPYALAFAAGAMVYVIMDDIIPEAHISGNGKLASWASILGFVVMMSLDVGLG
ncbi:zinc transporter ZIP11 isoform X8 [Orcinus orca]|uniref:zinc transporter ZIP11 isoform X8 n=1 Tax=Orcinus orca TaxID=9733 RepID=UPI0021137566|nr:zinc transporter ZIP11 isoform X8 [Orcinus orca]